MQKIQKITALVLVMLLVPACAMKMLIADNMTGLLLEIEGSYRNEASYGFGREAGAGLLKTCQGVIASSPDNPDLLLIGTRLHAQFALGFMDEEDPDFARSLYSTAKSYGLRLLDDDQLESSIARGPAQVRERLKSFGPEDAEALLWTGVAIAGWINLKRDSVRALADLPSALVFIERVLELDDGIFYGGAHLVLGRYYGSLGTELGGNPDKAQKEFQLALDISGGRFLLAKVDMALFVAVPKQDRNLFDRLLNEVLSAPTDILPGDALITAVAQHRARELIETADDYFVDSPGKTQ